MEKNFKTKFFILDNISAISTEYLAKIIRNTDICVGEWYEELCRRAGLIEEWNNATGENFEEVVHKAAEILGVTI